jgi:glutamate carboxypeptidase
MLKKSYQKILDTIASDYNEMTSLLEQWVNVNSHGENLAGLTEMMTLLKQSFSSLKGQMTEISLPPRQVITRKGENLPASLGKALHIRKHPSAPIQIFFGGHMDTVYPLSSLFQKASKIDNNTLKGPGVADMKGGLVIMLKTLQMLEKNSSDGKIGWEVLINPDEEMGSPGSRFLFKDCAERNNVGLIFEPSFADGGFVGPRKGSTNYTIVSKGRSAHAGRDFFEGSNAITALAKFVILASELTDREKGITVNIGSIDGGEAINTVPDLAIARMNIRAWHQDQWIKIKNDLESILATLNQMDGPHLTLHENTTAPPKPFDRNIESLFNSLAQCAQLINLDFQVKPSGGVCDGSRLYAEGLPNIDTLGIVGGELHTENEYAFLPSLIERTQLATLLVLLFANQKNDSIL